MFLLSRQKKKERKNFSALLVFTSCFCCCQIKFKYLDCVVFMYDTWSSCILQMQTRQGAHRIFSLESLPLPAQHNKHKQIFSWCSERLLRREWTLPYITCYVVNFSTANKRTERRKIIYFEHTFDASAAQSPSICCLKLNSVQKKKNDMKFSKRCNFSALSNLWKHVKCSWHAITLQFDKLSSSFTFVETMWSSGCCISIHSAASLFTELEWQFLLLTVLCNKNFIEAMFVVLSRESIERI